MFSECFVLLTRITPVKFQICIVIIRNGFFCICLILDEVKRSS